MISKIVGVHFRPPAKLVLGELAGGTELLLRPEPENPYDEFAIAVCISPEALRDGLARVGEDFEEQLAGCGLTLTELLGREEPLHLGYIPKVVACTVRVGDPKGKLVFDMTGAPSVEWEEIPR